MIRSKEVFAREKQNPELLHSSERKLMMTRFPFSKTLRHGFFLSFHDSCYAFFILHSVSDGYYFLPQSALTSNRDGLSRRKDRQIIDFPPVLLTDGK